MSSSCTPKVLAESRGCSVSICEHGTAYLTVGCVTLRMSRASLSPLAEVLAGALEAAQRPPTESSQALH